MAEKIIDGILQLLPFGSWFESLGMNKQAAAGLSLLAAVLLIWLLRACVIYLWERNKNDRTAKNLYPQFDDRAVRKATRIYIPTRYQNASPARQDEPGFTHQYVSSSPLIPFFIKKAFNERIDGERFYLVLADSGMGKTTFMINLFIQYHALFNRHRKYGMRLLRFSHPDIMSEIKAVKKEEARNTILLLDALDEDPNIVSKDPNITDAQAFQRRVDEIIEATRNFREVVMTCRTQYFPGQENDPYELKVKRSDEKGFYVLNKLYLSPFDDKEVKRYLNKKYGYLPLWNRARKKRAARVVQQSRHILMRPMMLSYIDYFVAEERKYDSAYDIYETLIEKWLVREGEKRKSNADRQAFIDNLRSVSQQTALAIWDRWRGQQRTYLTREEAVNIAREHHFELRPEEVTGQSLLTCDGAGNWKFAHKSVWEFFLAKAMLENPQSLGWFHFVGMDMVWQFFLEKNPENLVLVNGGKFMMGEDSEAHEVSLATFCIGRYQVTQSQFTELTGNQNPSHFKDNPNCPVENVSWFDAIQFCNLLNRKYGFPDTYDAEGNLLDIDGKTTRNLARVHGFRLPTEAEWEYAARGGSKSKGYEYSGSNNLKEVGWHNKNAGDKTHPVGSLKPNELGLYDMSGNVWEWCHDWYDTKYYSFCKGKGTAENPIGPDTGSLRVLRGGSWLHVAQNCRAAYRDANTPGYRNHYLGFRLALSLQSDGSPFPAFL